MFFYRLWELPFLPLYLAPPQPDPAPATGWDPILLRPGSFYQKKTKISLNPHSLRPTYQAGAQGLKPGKAEESTRNRVFDSR